jgi:hypothetical protein
VLTEKEVLGRLAEAGFKIPPSRFENWRERGLLPPAETRPGRGRGLGRVANLYPEITIDQVKQIVALRQQNFDLGEIGWRLWLAGHAVGRDCWFDVFATGAAEFDVVASAFRDALNSDNDDAIQELVDQAYRAETSHSLFRQVRKALGPDRLSSIVLHIMNMALGEFTAVSTQAERLTRDEEEMSVTAQMQDPRIKERQADLRAMDVALGLGHARSDTVNGVGPIISGDYSVILRDTFAPLASTTLTEFLKQVDPERLRTVTRDFSALTQSIAVASEKFSKTLAKDAFGLGRTPLLARSGRKLQAQMGLIWTLILERSTGKFHDLGGMINLFNAAALAVGQSAQPNADGLNGPIFRRGPTRKPIK